MINEVDVDAGEETSKKGRERKPNYLMVALGVISLGIGLVSGLVAGMGIGRGDEWGRTGRTGYDPESQARQEWREDLSLVEEELAKSREENEWYRSLLDEAAVELKVTGEQMEYWGKAERYFPEEPAKELAEWREQGRLVKFGCMSGYEVPVGDKYWGLYNESGETVGVVEDERLGEWKKFWLEQMEKDEVYNPRVDEMDYCVDEREREYVVARHTGGGGGAGAVSYVARLTEEGLEVLGYIYPQGVYPGCGVLAVRDDGGLVMGCSGTGVEETYLVEGEGKRPELLWMCAYKFTMEDDDVRRCGGNFEAMMEWWVGEEWRGVVGEE